MKYFLQLLCLLPMLSSARIYDFLTFCTCEEEYWIKCYHDVVIKEQTISMCEDSTIPMKLYIELPTSMSNFMLESVVDNITELYIFKPMFDALPSELLRFNKLTNLTANYGSLTSFAFDSTYTFQNLNILNLANNDITYIEIAIDHTYAALHTIVLDHNQLQDINIINFKSFPNLTHLSITHNDISNININTFNDLDNLLYLDLSNNKIDTLEGSLMKLVKLKELRLNHNYIKAFDEEDLALNRLQILQLNNNLIVDIDNSVFSYLPELTIADLSHNNIEFIDNDLFTNSNNLRRLNMSYNNIKLISPNIFNNNKLEYFNIEGNKLEIPLQKGIFAGLDNVETLDLSNQNIGAIEDQAFSGVNTLKNLNISYNNIKLLSTQALRFLNKLIMLDLSHNLLYHANIDINDLPDLQWLQLNDNRLVTLDCNLLNMLPNLTHFDISNNNINKITPCIQTNKHRSQLVSLDMSHNSLTIIKNESFQYLTALQELNISKCMINTLEFNVFRETGALGVIDLSTNCLTHFNVNTTNLKLLTTLILSNNMITSVPDQTLLQLVILNKLYLLNNTLNSPLNLSNNILLSHISLQFNLTEHIYFNTSHVNNFHTLILSGIKGIEKTSQQLSGVHISVLDSDVTELSELNLSQFNNLKYISLISNKLSTIEKDDFSHQIFARYIDLSNNYISYVQPGSFKNNLKLEVLNISHNRLTNLGYGVFEGLLSLNTLDLSFNSLLTLKIKISYNLRNLILDNNNIEDLRSFCNVGFSIVSFSIGNNDIPCSSLISIENELYGTGRSLTALKLDYHKENVHGITCKGETPRNVTNAIMTPDLVPALNNLSIDIRNLSVEIHEHIIMHDDVTKLESNVTDTEYVARNKSKHHSLTQIYDSLKSENVNILSLIESVRGELGMTSRAIICLSAVLGIGLGLVFVYVIMKYVNLNYFCYKLRANGYSPHSNVDAVEMQT